MKISTYMLLTASLVGCVHSVADGWIGVMGCGGVLGEALMSNQAAAQRTRVRTPARVRVSCCCEDER